MSERTRIAGMLLMMMLVGTTEATAYNYSKVILVAWDGVEYDTLEGLYNSGQLPGLGVILENNSFSNGSMPNSSFARLYITDHVTWTDPGFAQMLGGYSTTTTGMDGLWNYQQIPTGYTVFEGIKAARPDINTSAIVSRDATYYLTNNMSRLSDAYNGLAGHGFMRWNFNNFSRGIDYAYDPINWSVENSDYINYTTKAHQNYTDNNTVYNIEINSSEIESATEKWLINNTNKSFFLFIHFAEPDTTGHNYGGNSTQYSNAIITADNSTLKLYNYINNLSIMNDTVILVTTDHGFFVNASGHLGGNYPYNTFYNGLNQSVPQGYAVSRQTHKTFIAANKRVWSGIAVGDIADIAPTVYDLFNIDYATVVPAIDKGIPLTNRQTRWIFGEKEDSWNNVSFSNVSNSYAENGSIVVGHTADYFDRINSTDPQIIGINWSIAGGIYIYKRGMAFNGSNNRAFYQAFNGSGYNLSVRLNAIDGNITNDDVRYVIMFYIQNITNVSGAFESKYQFIVAPNLTTTIQLKYDNATTSTSTQIGTTPNFKNFTSGDLITIDTSTVGTGLKVYRNGSLLYTFPANSSYTYGGIGLGTTTVPTSDQRAWFKDLRVWNTTTGNLTGSHDFGSQRRGSNITVLCPNCDANLTADLYLSQNSTTWNLRQVAVTSGTKYTIPDTDRNQTQYLRLVLNGNLTNSPLILNISVEDESVTFIPPDPVSLANTTGNYWVNHTWSAGVGNITDSYNVNVNGVWTNGSTSTYMNTSGSAGSWVNISVWAYNSSGTGTLSLTGATMDTQIPAAPANTSCTQLERDLLSLVGTMFIIVLTLAVIAFVYSTSRNPVYAVITIMLLVIVGLGTGWLIIDSAISGACP